MSATPARGIAKVESYTRPDGARRCKVTLDTGEVVPLSSLTRVELLKAAKIAFPETNGKAWFKVSNEQIKDAIRGEKVPDGLGDETPTPKTPAKPKPEPKAPKAVDEAPKADDPLLAALKAFVEEHGIGKVSEDDVRQVVDEAVKAAADRLPNVKVEVVTPKGTNELPEAHHPLLPKIVRYLSAGVNLFLVGPAGSGKSTIAEHAAAALGLPFHTISFGPTTPTSKVFGYNDGNGRHVRTPFREAWEFGGVFCGDEQDNGHPGLVAELNQALAGTRCAFADKVVDRHPDFRYVATGNTFGRGPDRLFVGRNILDAATLDRFTTVEVPIDEPLERAIALAYAGKDDAALREKIEKHVDLVQATRAKVLEHGLTLVVSPRASIDGAKLLASGASPAEVREDRLCPGWSNEHRAKCGLPKAK